ncbi:putative sugar nucleotidyl transferase, partial [Rubrivirga sp.]|uniref:putative sugar nucleotidyl transferase n=1 Tax=Rubrivirga sp. TaxID=1885344 RepID=UPI003C764A10
MTLCLFEDDRVGHLAPLTLTRAAYDLRVGARTLLENATSFLPADHLILHTRADLEGVTRLEYSHASVNADLESRQAGAANGTLFVNGRWLVREGAVFEAVKAATRHDQARAFVQGDVLLAAWHPSPRRDVLEADALGPEAFDGIPVERVGDAILIERLWDLISDLENRITHDLTSMGSLGVLEGEIEDGATI